MINVVDISILALLAGLPRFVADLWISSMRPTTVPTPRPASPRDPRG